MFRTHLGYSSLLYVIENLLSQKEGEMDKAKKKRFRDERKRVVTAIVSFEDVWDNWNEDTNDIPVFANDQ